METQFGTKVAEGEDDVRTSNTQYTHSTMKNTLRSVTECCNNTHQGSPHTGKQSAKMYCACNTSPKLALQTSVTTSHVTCLIVFGRRSVPDLATLDPQSAGDSPCSPNLCLWRLNLGASVHAAPNPGDATALLL